MKAVIIERSGGPEVLALVDRPVPEVGPGETLVRVAAAAVNRADILQRRGFYPPPAGAPTDIPGLEFSGFIEAIGERVTEWKVGDRVMGIVAGGAYAESLVVDARHLIPVPSSMTMETAAAIPEAFVTAWDAMFNLLQVEKGEALLIHAVGSGVGTAAVRLAQAFGIVSIGTSRTPDKIDAVRALGLDHGIDSSAGHWSESVLEETGGRGVECILDLVGGDYLNQNLAVLADRGRIAVVGLVGGRSPEIDLGQLLSKRVTVIGTVLRSRSADEKAELISDFTDSTWSLMEGGHLDPVIDGIYPFSETGAAHERMESNSSTGKIVLTW